MSKKLIDKLNLYSVEEVKNTEERRKIIGDHFKDFEEGNASIFIGGEKARESLKQIEEILNEER